MRSNVLGCAPILLRNALERARMRSERAPKASGCAPDARREIPELRSDSEAYPLKIVFFTSFYNERKKHAFGALFIHSLPKHPPTLDAFDA